MAFKEVNDLSTDTVVSLGGTNKKTGKKNPTSIEGYFVGKRRVEDRKKKSGFSYIYVFQTSKGNIGVWGKTDLDRKMSAANPGVMTRATFTGMRPTPNGEMYVFKVEIDSDNTIEVTAGDEGGASEEENNDSGFEAGYADDEDDGGLLASSNLGGNGKLTALGNAQLAEVSTNAVDEAAARRAKVQALLSKKKA